MIDDKLFGILYDHLNLRNAKLKEALDVIKHTPTQKISIESSLLIDCLIELISCVRIMQNLMDLINFYLILIKFTFESFFFHKNKQKKGKLSITEKPQLLVIENKKKIIMSFCCLLFVIIENT